MPSPKTEHAPRKRAPGGGRKPLAGPDDPTRGQVVTMPESLWKVAEEAGDGKASPGIREALKHWQRRRKPRT